jgi:hypothetical protein
LCALKLDNLDSAIVFHHPARNETNVKSRTLRFFGNNFGGTFFHHR